MGSHGASKDQSGWRDRQRCRLDPDSSRQRQIFGPERIVATELEYTRYDKVVEACGGRGFYVETTDALAGAFEEAFACPEPALVNVKIGASDFRKNAISV